MPNVILGSISCIFFVLGFAIGVATIATAITLIPYYSAIKESDRCKKMFISAVGAISANVFCFFILILIDYRLYLVHLEIALFFSLLGLLMHRSICPKYKIDKIADLFHYN